MIGPTRLPVDPFKIARELGIQVFTDAALASDIAGKLIKRSGFDDPEILLNANDSRNRQRFTCGHELGHYNRRINEGDAGEWNYVDHRSNLATSGGEPDEVYANQFAAALLMPASDIKRLSHLPTSLLANEFGVSGDAMLFRLKNLNLVK